MAQLKEVVGRFPDAKLVVGHTSAGVYGADNETRVFVHLGALSEVCVYTCVCVCVCLCVWARLCVFLCLRSACTRLCVRVLSLCVF